MSDFFWFSDTQWARIEPLLPTDLRGKPRVDDRRVLSGIVHALRSGGRWTDCADFYRRPAASEQSHLSRAVALASGPPSTAQRQTGLPLHGNSSRHRPRQKPGTQIHRKRLSHPCRPPSPARILNRKSCLTEIPSEFKTVEKLSNSTQKRRGDHSTPPLGTDTRRPGIRQQHHDSACTSVLIRKDTAHCG